MLTDQQKLNIANKLWKGFLESALRYDAPQSDLGEIQDILRLTYALAKKEQQKQYRRSPKLRVCGGTES